MTSNATKYCLKESTTHEGLFAYYVKPYSILTPDEAEGASPLRDKVWFERFQPLLLKMANTDYGRDLLHIENRPYIVTDFRKDHVKYYMGNGKSLWDFRTGCKWGNVIRGRWAEFKKFAKEFYEIELEGKKMYRPLLQYKGELVAAGATDTFLPEAWEGDDTVSGIISHQHHSYGHSGYGVGVTYQHIIMADGGNETSHASPTTANYADLVTLHAASRDGGGTEDYGAYGWAFVTQYFRPRDDGHSQDSSAVIIFDTSSIDSAVVESATFSWFNAETDASTDTTGSANAYAVSTYNASQSESKAVLMWSDIDTASDTVLEPDDWYDRAGGASQAGNAHRYNSGGATWESASFPASESRDYVDVTIATSGEPYSSGGGIDLINTSGTTQLCSFDATYGYIAWGGDTGIDRGRDPSTGGASDYAQYRTGDHTGTSSDPKLVVVSVSAFTPQIRFITSA